MPLWITKVTSRTPAVVAAVLAVISMSVAACKSEKPAPEPVKDTTAKKPDDYVDQGTMRDTGYSAANAKNFPMMVRKEFAHMATNVPKSVMNRYLDQQNPKAIQDSVTKYLHYRDSLARESLALKYGISLDSLDKIIKSK